MDYALTEIPAVESFLNHPVVTQELQRHCVSLRLLSVHGEYLYVSGGVRDLYGYEPEELLTIDAWTLVHPAEVPVMQQAGVVVFRGEAVEATLRMLCKNGEYRWVYSRLTPFESTVAVFVEPAEAPTDGKAHWKAIQEFL